MPWAPRKLCAGDGCRELVPAGTTRCPSCTTAQTYAYRASRPPKLVEFYSSTRWKKFREEQRRDRPWCECTDPECVHVRILRVARCPRPSVVPDHQIEPMKNWSLALSPNNITMMCSHCHSSKTARLQSWHKPR